MLSGDQSARCKYIALRTGIFPRNRIIYKAKFKQKNEAVNYIDCLLDEISQKIQEDQSSKSSRIKINQEKFKNWCLIISGQQFDIILQDQFLRNHFAFILAFIPYLIGYEFSPK